jgi:hypothetical protein
VSDSLLFSFLPYAAVVAAVTGTVHRVTVHAPAAPGPRRPAHAAAEVLPAPALALATRKDVHV